MKVEKIGHCCLVIDTGGKRVMTDPGSFSVGQEEIENVDVVLITHEHGDHLHIESLKKVIAKNPFAMVVTNTAVSQLLEKEGIAATVLEGVEEQMIAGIHFAAHDAPHAEIFEKLGQVQNTGYHIAQKLFYPGDAFTTPRGQVDVLALPVAGPWCKMSDALRYALSVKPRIVFPVHDGMIEKNKIAVAHGAPGKILPEYGIAFTPLTAGESAEF